MARWVRGIWIPGEAFEFPFPCDVKQEEYEDSVEKTIHCLARTTVGGLLLGELEKYSPGTTIVPWGQQAFPCPVGKERNSRFQYAATLNVRDWADLHAKYRKYLVADLKSIGPQNKKVERSVEVVLWFTPRQWLDSTPRLFPSRVLLHELTHALTYHLGLHREDREMADFDNEEEFGAILMENLLVSEGRARKPDVCRYYRANHDDDFKRMDEADADSVSYCSKYHEVLRRFAKDLPRIAGPLFDPIRLPVQSAGDGGFHADEGDAQGHHWSASLTLRADVEGRRGRGRPKGSDRFGGPRLERE